MNETIAIQIKSYDIDVDYNGCIQIDKEFNLYDTSYLEVLSLYFRKWKIDFLNLKKKNQEKIIQKVCEMLEYEQEEF